MKAPFCQSPKLALLFATMTLIGGSVCAQEAMVMPAGKAHLSGTDDDNCCWESPVFRLLVVYDAAQFPWDSHRSFTIRGLRIRRSGTINFEYTDPRRESKVVISINGVKPEDLNKNSGRIAFSSAHGHGEKKTDGPKEVFSGNVQFPCQEAVAFLAVSPFVVDIKFPQGKEFTVPANSQSLPVNNLVIEFQVTRNDLNKRWIVDHEKSASSAIDRGGLEQFGVRCPQLGSRKNCKDRTPRAMDDVIAGGFAVGSRFRFSVLPDASKASHGCIWFGTKRDPMQLPNGCKLYVDPLIPFAIVIQGSRLDLNGVVPNDSSLEGFKLYSQAAVPTPEWPGGFGMTAGYAITIGSGKPVTAQFAAMHGQAGAGQSLPRDGFTIGSVPVIEFY